MGKVTINSQQEHTNIKCCSPRGQCLPWWLHQCGDVRMILYRKHWRNRWAYEHTYHATIWFLGCQGSYDIVLAATLLVEKNVSDDKYIENDNNILLCRPIAWINYCTHPMSGLETLPTAASNALITYIVYYIQELVPKRGFPSVNRVENRFRRGKGQK